jgi:hypothetical protein
MNLKFWGGEKFFPYIDIKRSYIYIEKNIKQNYLSNHRRKKKEREKIIYCFNVS